MMVRAANSLIAIHKLTHQKDLARKHLPSFARSSGRLFAKIFKHSSGKIHPRRSGSPFAACTVNLGPQTVTRVHLDRLNAPYGYCAITPFGNYDYTKGAQLIIWDLKIILEFPPTYTIFIPSALLAHSNAPLASSDEKRYSITQYTASYLHQYANHNFKHPYQASKKERQNAEQYVPSSPGEAYHRLSKAHYV
jgi:hypothetical protein